MMIMRRSFADSWGFNWPPQIAMLVDGKAVTYLQLLNEKRKKQRDHLEQLRMCNTVFKPCFVETFYNDCFGNGASFFAGWWAYVQTLKKGYPIGFQGQNEKMKTVIMKLFPCGFLPLTENFYQWMEAFGETYHRETSKRKKRGAVKAWAKIKHGYLADIAIPPPS